MSRILVVDDEATARGLLKDILTSAAFEVMEAEDGERALDTLTQYKIDLIITDRSMPIMNGLDLLAAVQKKGLKIPILMISGFGEEKFWGQAIGLGAVDYLVKPFKTEDVLKLVKKHVKPENSK